MEGRGRSTSSGVGRALNEIINFFKYQTNSISNHYINNQTTKCRYQMFIKLLNRLEWCVKQNTRTIHYITNQTGIIF